MSRNHVAPSRGGWIEATAWVAGLVAWGLCLPATAQSSQVVKWLLEDGGSRPAPWIVQACGSYGVFSFCDATTSPCDPGGSPLGGGGGPVLLASGVAKDPRVYPSPAGSTGSGATPEPGGLEGGQLPAFLPCDEGGCFSKHTDLSDPWVAVVDWDEPHGWTVGWTIGRASALSQDLKPQVQLGFFDVDALRFRELAPRGVTDVQVVASLCRIVELVEREGVVPPRVVNLSLGRFLEGEDHEPCLDSTSGRLGCQVEQVIRHLEERLDHPATFHPRVVAAAGNFRTLAFPAGTNPVQAVETLDVERFGAAGVTEPSWESPGDAAAAAFLPGSGLCLKEGSDSPGWPAPAGSSYATALFSGWMATALSKGWIEGPDEEVAWYPVRSCGASGCWFKMGGSKPTATTPGLDETLRRVVAFEGNCGGSPQVPGDDLVARLTRLTDPEVMPRRSFLEMVGLAYVPSPDPEPCVPCESAPRPPNRTRTTGPRGGVVAADPGPIPVRRDLVVRFQFSLPLPERVEIEAVMLRVGTTFYRAELSAEQIASLARGGVRTLRLLDGLNRAAESTRQSSLVFVLAADQGERYWASTPLRLTN